MGLDIVDLFQKVEKSFGIRFPNREASEAVTVGALCALTWRHLPQGHAFTEEEVSRQILDIVADHAGLDLSEIRMSDRFGDDLGLD